MSSAVYTPSSRGIEAAAGGYSLVELLTAMLLSGVLLSVMARDFSFTVATRHDLDLVVETQHAVRATLSEITQELRQVGACLPATGNFMAVDGENNGEQDRLTLRIGRVNPESVVCVRTILTKDAGAGNSTLTVEDSGQFALDSLVYLARGAGDGKIFKVAGIGTETITLEGGLDTDYATGTGVFALEERTYEVDKSSGQPVLMVSIDEGEPQPLVAGVERFNVQYLQAPCPPCDPVDQPGNDAEWYRVREVSVDIGVVSRVARHGGELLRLSGQTNVRPRNLL